MDNAIVVDKTVHGLKTGLLFEVDTNKVQGFGIALGLGIVALACILAKCLFLYYIRVHAPKERPMNRLMALEQVRFISCILFQFFGNICHVSGDYVDNASTSFHHGSWSNCLFKNIPRHHRRKRMPC